MGTSHSDQCNRVTKIIWEWCIDENIWISLAHIPGKQNLVPDHESRRNQRKSEWMLNKALLFDGLERLNFMPEIDLIATHTNKQLPKYVSCPPNMHLHYNGKIWNFMHSHLSVSYKQYCPKFRARKHWESVYYPIGQHKASMQKPSKWWNRTQSGSKPVKTYSACQAIHRTSTQYGTKWTLSSISYQGKPRQTWLIISSERYTYGLMEVRYIEAIPNTFMPIANIL